MKNQNKKDTKKLAVRIMAWVLAGLMVLSIAYLTVALASDALFGGEETEQTDK